MAKLTNIDLAYSFLKEKNNPSTFQEISNYVLKQNRIDSSQVNLVMAGLYSSLVLDNRFSLTPDGNWVLRGNVKFEDVKKQYANLLANMENKKTKVKESVDSEEDIDDDLLEDEEEEIDEEIDEEDIDAFDDNE